MCFCVAVFCAFLSFEKLAGSGITVNSMAAPSSLQQQEFHAFEAQGFQCYRPTYAFSLETKNMLKFTSLDIKLTYLVALPTYISDRAT